MVVSVPKLLRTGVCFPKTQRLPWKVDGVVPPPRAGRGTISAPPEPQPRNHSNS